MNERLYPNPNLVTRVLGHFGQRVNACSDSVILDAIFLEKVIPVLVRMLEIRTEVSDSHNDGLKWRVEYVGEKLISVLLNYKRNWNFLTINSE